MKKYLTNTEFIQDITHLSSTHSYGCRFSTLSTAKNFMNK